LKRLIDQFLSFWIRPPSLILKEWVGLAPASFNSTALTPTKKRLCFFSHFDPDGKIDDYVVFYLKNLVQLGADILFVSTSENLLETELEKVLPYCIHLIQRKNISLDFGSWKICWDKARDDFKWLEQYDQLILANDSVYGPLFPLKEVFNQMESRGLDLWGTSSSAELEPHLQSYFLVFEKKAMRSPELKKFWKNFRFYRSKPRIIAEYELGVSRLAHRIGWKTGAFIDFDASQCKALNSTLFSWDTLIEQDHFPFLKTEVLKLNRASSPRVTQWPEILKSQTGYPVDLIQRHLKRILELKK
jgi:lipopolysaccharide biosynthesis protein